MRGSLNQGIFRLWPGRIRSLLRPLAALIFATEEPLFRAMEESVSPFETVYFGFVDFLPVVLAPDFEDIDFFFAEVLEAVAFLWVVVGVDDGVTFFELPKL